MATVEAENAKNIALNAYGGNKGTKPPFDYHGFHHLEFYVSNAKQVSDFYVLRLGFTKVAWRGLETGSRNCCSHVVKQNDIVFVFTSPLNPSFSPESGCGHMMMDIALKGDAVKDVAFECDDANKVYEHCLAAGGTGIKAPWKETDEFGTVTFATVETYGKCRHTLISYEGGREAYKGHFLPGFKAITEVDPIAITLPKINLQFIDHVVGNQPDRMMDHTAQWYEDKLGFHRFWSVDDKTLHTQYSSLRSTVMADHSEKIKMPINEPAMGMKKSQIQEYVDYHGGAGVQHVALRTFNILDTITQLRARGVQFLTIPDSYYDHLKTRLSKAKIKVKEDIDELKKRQILVDFDDEGYLLQIFTTPVEDRPTLFYEVIQRENNQGFGVGNFKALFESIELAQKERGNL